MINPMQNTENGVVTRFPPEPSYVASNPEPGFIIDCPPLAVTSISDMPRLLSWFVTFAYRWINFANIT